GVFDRGWGIEKLIKYQKSPDAAQSYTALLNSKETAIGATETTIAVRIHGTPPIRIVGPLVGAYGSLKQARHHRELRHNLRSKAHRQASSVVIEITPCTQYPFIRLSTAWNWLKVQL